MSADTLHSFASKYIWWKSPEEALRFPDRVIGQVMNLGTLHDIQTLAETVGTSRLSEVIKHAEPGWFTTRSWHYWHFRLGLAEVDEVPPLPQRRFS